MSMQRAGIALLLAAASALCVGCDSKSKSCNQFFDVAAPILSAVAVPSSAPSGSAAVAWARDAAKQYDRLSQEAGKIADGEFNRGVKTALEDEKRAAALVAKQLEALAEAATAVEPAKIVTIKTELATAAKAEKEVARDLERTCAP